MSGNPQQPDDPDMQALMQVLDAVYAEQERKVGKVDIRPEDGSLETSAWNAIVLGHPNRIQDMRGTTAFALDLVSRLIDNGKLRPAAGAFAPAMIAAFLR